jgi:mono/diheme cytochrome c family protein
MNAFQGRKLSWRLFSVTSLLAALPVMAQNAPPLPPLPTASSKPLPHPVRPAVAPAASAVSVAPVAPPTVAAVSPATRTLPAPAASPVPTVVPNVVGPVAPPVQNLFTPVDASIIKFDAETKEHDAKLGDPDAKYTFWLTNVSPSEVLINSVRTSCGCTVAKLPSQPWHIASGSNGPIEVTVNLAGKSGMISKGVTVETSVGIKQLTVKCNIPINTPGALPVQQSGTMGDADRLKNMQQALADRQVVFKNKECATCHAEPAKNKTDGRVLYAGVCATCHNSHHRAAQVPDLRLLKHPTDADYWRQWIAHGRPGSMMPAYAESEGGPLNDQQITALVDFMLKAFPSRAASLQ